MGAERTVVDQTDPVDAFEALQSDASSLLIDVRTGHEWKTVGLPDLSELGKKTICVEWVRYPDRSPNPDFLEQVIGAVGETAPGRIFFICRSGARSLAAANVVAEALGSKGGSVHCTNVAEGFEGNQPAAGGTGSANGWKARGLPWHLLDD